MSKRRRHSAAFKFKAALAAAKEQQTLSQLASTYQVYATQVSQWKRQLLQEGAQVFSAPQTRQQREQATREAVRRQVTEIIALADQGRLGVLQRQADAGARSRSMRLGDSLAALGPWEGESTEKLMSRLSEARRTGGSADSLNRGMPTVPLSSEPSVLWSDNA